MLQSSWTVYSHDQGRFEVEKKEYLCALEAEGGWAFGVGEEA